MTRTELLAKAEAWIAAHREEYITELQMISRIPSVSRADLAAPGAPFGPDCRKVLDHALERGRFYGFDTADHDGYAGSITWGDADNSIGVIAHLDVVPVGDGWVYPTFGATYLPEHDVLIGRGVDDNKSAFVGGLFAMRMLREFGVPMRHGIRLICGTSEETGMQDMQALRKMGHRFPDTSLVPDAGFPVNYAQKGMIDGAITIPCEGNLVQFDSGSVRNVIPDEAVCVVVADIETVRAALSAVAAEDAALIEVSAVENGVRIVAKGKSGHAAFPAGGDNAIARLTRVLTAADLLTGTAKSAVAALAELTADSYGRSEGVAFSDEPSGELTLVYGVAHLKNGLLTVSVDSRYSVTMDGAKLESDLRAAWAKLGFTVKEFDISAPFYIPVDDPRVTALMSLYKDVTGRDDPPYAMGGGTYSRAVPGAISFGPGMPGVKHDYSAFLPEGHGGAHGRDEVLPIDKMLFCSKIYVAALAELDGGVE